MMKKRNKKNWKSFLNKRKGFTLVEVAIALAIVSSVIVWTYTMIAQGLMMQRESIHLSNAVHLAKIKMSQIESAQRLEATTAKGPIPGYPGYKFETEIKEEEMDLLKLAKGEGDKSKNKPPDDLLGGNNNTSINELMKKRGQSMEQSQTGGIIPVFKITLDIIYPSGAKEDTFRAQTFKSKDY